MAALRDELLTESTALLSITNHISDFLAERRSERTYLVETESFFKYVSETLEAIRRFVDTAVSGSDACGNTTLLANLRDIKALELVIRQMYRLVRQVCDADTLAIPFPIITHINSAMEEFPLESGARNARILLLATDELNFLHHRLDAIMKVCHECPIVPDFPPNLGVIAFPYTERNNICLNSLLFHELGHFVFQRAGLTEELLTSLHDLDAQIQAIVGGGSLFEQPVMQKNAKQRILSWCNELFSDLFATSLVGPSYAIAFDRLVRLSGSQPSQQVWFTDRHPADLFRKKQIAEFLIAEGWIIAVEHSDPEKANLQVLDSLRADATASSDWKYLLDNAALSQLMLDSFMSVVPKVTNAVREISAHLDTHCDDFMKYYAAIAAALLHLTVPSVQCKGNGEVFPSPAVILICGSLLLRQDLGAVFALTTRDPHDMRDRLWIEDRINRLVMKGMEDSLVLSKWCQP